MAGGEGEGDGNYRRQQRHADYRAKAVHNPNQQAAHGKFRAVFMVVRGFTVRPFLTGMRVSVDMHITGVVAVDMNIDTFANKPVNDVSAKGHEHDADSGLETIGD